MAVLLNTQNPQQVFITCTEDHADILVDAKELYGSSVDQIIEQLLFNLRQIMHDESKRKISDDFIGLSRADQAKIRADIQEAKAQGGGRP